MNLSIVIPIFNEVENVPRIRHELFPALRELAKSYLVEVVFIDDGSTDGSFQALEHTFTGIDHPRLRFRLERHSMNQGLGAALRTGFASACGEIVVTTDSDGSYRFSEISALVFCLTPEVDIVTASPYHPNGKVEGVSTYRILLSRGSSLLYRLLLDWRIWTYTSLFRAYRREVLENISFECNGYRAVTEILVKGMLQGYRIAEYPATLHKRTLGTSKVRLFQTILDHLRFQTLVLFHRLSLKPMVKQTVSNKDQRSSLSTRPYISGDLHR